jgi:hypothetical protein
VAQNPTKKGARSDFIRVRQSVTLAAGEEGYLSPPFKWEDGTYRAFLRYGLREGDGDFADADVNLNRDGDSLAPDDGVGFETITHDPEALPAVRDVALEMEFNRGDSDWGAKVTDTRGSGSAVTYQVTWIFQAARDRSELVPL